MIGIVALLLAPGAAAVWAVRGRRSGRTIFLAFAGWAAVSLVAMSWLLLQLAFVSEGSLPPDDLASSLPPGVQVAEHGDSCGSGGCARVYVLRGDPGVGVADVAELVKQSVVTGCHRPRWAPDLREHCKDVAVINGRVVVHSYLQGL